MTIKGYKSNNGVNGLGDLLDITSSTSITISKVIFGKNFSSTGSYSVRIHDNSSVICCAIK